jgi:hypothetical protein
MSPRSENREPKGVGKKRSLARVSCDPSRGRIRQDPAACVSLSSIHLSKSALGSNTPDQRPLRPRIRHGQNPHPSKARIESGCCSESLPKGARASTTPTQRGVNKPKLITHVNTHRRFFSPSTENAENPGKPGLNTILPEYRGALVAVPSRPIRTTDSLPLAATGDGRFPGHGG